MNINENKIFDKKRDRHMYQEIAVKVPSTQKSGAHVTAVP